MASFGQALSRTWRDMGVMPSQASAATRSPVVTAVRDMTDLSRVPATDRYPSPRGVQLAAVTGNVDLERPFNRRTTRRSPMDE